MSKPETKIIEAIGYLIQMHGSEVGLDKCLIDGNSRDSSVVFTHDGQDYLLSSKDVKEV